MEKLSLTSSTSWLVISELGGMLTRTAGPFHGTHGPSPTPYVGSVTEPMKDKGLLHT